MKILNFFESRIKGKIANIGIGLGSEQSQNLKVFKTTQYFLRKNSIDLAHTTCGKRYVTLLNMHRFFK